MTCSCINKVFDLKISSRGLTTMVIEDQSIWMNRNGFSEGESIEVDIKTTTSRAVIKTLPLYVNRRNIITAADLYGATEGTCFEDDLYCFSVVSCGEKFSINRAFMPRAYCSLDSLISNNRDAADERIINKVRMLINMIESQTELNEGEAAKKTYQKLEEILEKLNCDCCK